MNAFLNIWLLMLFISLLPSYIISQHETNTRYGKCEMFIIVFNKKYPDISFTFLMKISYILNILYYVMFSVQESEKTQLKVWDMAKEFGEKNKVVSWIFYFEVSVFRHITCGTIFLKN